MAMYMHITLYLFVHIQMDKAIESHYGYYTNAENVCEDSRN